MKTNVHLKDNRILRAHFTHVRPEHFLNDRNYRIDLEELMKEAFSEGQIKQYNRHVDDCESSILCFENLFESNGITICELTEPVKEIDGLHKMVAVGFAFCSPLDQFEKKKGRSVAFRRALWNLQKKGFEVEKIEYIKDKQNKKEDK